MSDQARARTLWWKSVLFWVIPLILLISLAGLVSAGPEGEFLHHLLFGWISFLSGNISGISWNSDVWLPGLVAFLSASVVLHFMVRTWAGKRERMWPVTHTLALALVLPLMFGTSFMVPGTLLQMRRLATGGPMVWSNVRSEWSEIRRTLFGLAQELRLHVVEHDAYPDSLPLEITRGSEFIYLAAGRPVDSADSFPLVISPPYQTRSGKWERMILGADMRIEEAVSEEQAEEWIAQAVAARTGGR